MEQEMPVGERSEMAELGQSRKPRLSVRDSPVIHSIAVSIRGLVVRVLDKQVNPSMKG